MQQVASVQHAYRLQQLAGDLQPLHQRQRAAFGQQGRQRLPWVFAHQVVQVLAMAGSMHFGEMPACNAAQEPFFLQQTLRGAGLCFLASGQGLQ
ncbi:hypothetical protein D3C76_1433160 [compost metagenome]